VLFRSPQNPKTPLSLAFIIILKMKGEVLIHTETGEITTTLPTPIERNNEIGVAITNILQDIQMYMK
jgi:hypothetical protein